MVNKKILAIIPARGGSKRIPGKNIFPLLDKPMIAWTIEEALKSQYISDVIVSTDDTEIARVSEEYGASVPFLRDENADDISTVSEATFTCLNQYMKNHDKPDVIVQLMANCPNRKVKDIDNAIINFLKNNINFQISCFKYGWMNPWWAHTMDENGVASPLFDDNLRMMRSQDQEELFCPTGATWIAETDSFLQKKTFYGEDYQFYEMSWQAAVDIDDYNDLKMAEYLMSKPV